MVLAFTAKGVGENWAPPFCVEKPHLLVRDFWGGAGIAIARRMAEAPTGGHDSDWDNWAE